jgi:hypothetical protein
MSIVTNSTSSSDQEEQRLTGSIVTFLSMNSLPCESEYDQSNGAGDFWALQEDDIEFSLDVPTPTEDDKCMERI